ncbi:DUF4397 domain-containing protein [Hymenobacter sp. CRA2]|uniref:DUF4397 domain-containing protein n=1 Tax=Hymenobacter sp. CRA2 TaxID=1955620 RepID=UPI00098F352A|nr:DUF4397 domain-containing protein [Hymenobacter sp. CRA2]OON68107.1 hypothetical protein B0919_15760 [Hymenobacter sp. CRA2]
MNNPFYRVSRLLLLAALPAALLTTACGSDDNDDPPAPVVEKGRLLTVHAAGNAAGSPTVTLKVLADDTELGQLTYGQNTGYKDVNAGGRTIKVNVSSDNRTLVTQAVPVEKDKSYSLFAYATGTAQEVAGLLLTDDLTAPVANTAKVRVVHLAYGAPSPVRLIVPPATSTAPPTDLTPEIAFGAGSVFVDLNASGYNLQVATGATRTRVLDVGSRNYEAGKIYTILVQGVQGSFDQALQPKVTVIQHN